MKKALFLFLCVFFVADLLALETLELSEAEEKVVEANCSSIYPAFCSLDEFAEDDFGVCQDPDLDQQWVECSVDALNSLKN